MAPPPLLSPTKLVSAVDYNRRHGKVLANPAIGEESLALMIAALQQRHGVVVDGKWGEDTDDAIADELAALRPPAYTRKDAVERMDRILADDVKTYYKLSAGGSTANPDWPTWPWNSKHQLDCSALVGWLNDYARNDGDWNTDKIVSDAVRYDRINHVLKGPGPQTRFEVVAVVDNETGVMLVGPGKTVQPGDTLVYGGIFDPKTGERVKPGHTGGVYKLAPGFTPTSPTWWRDMQVVHSSPSNSQTHGTGHAVAATDAKIWQGLRQRSGESAADYAKRPKPVRFVVRLKAFAD